MRAHIHDALKQAIKEQDKCRTSTLRLINAAIKDRDIAARGDGNEGGVSDDQILDILAKMVKQRIDSAQTYEEAGRLELADQERREIAIIQEFLPKQLDMEEIKSAVETAINTLNACSLKDMGRVMSYLKEQYAGQMDFGKASSTVKTLLG